MNPRTVIATFGVVALVLLAGCAGLNPFAENPSTDAEKIESEMESIDTVQLNTTTTQVFSITDGNETINDTRRTQTLATYDFKNDSFTTSTLGQQRVFGQVEQFGVQQYYVDGKQYSRMANSATNNTTEWQVQEQDIDLQDRTYPVANADFLEHLNKSNTSTTIIYNASMLEDEAYIDSFLENETLTPFDGNREILDTYYVQIYVDKETHRLNEVRIFIQAELNNSEMQEIDDVYGRSNLTTTEGRITYATSVEYSAYNQPANVTLPESINQSETE